MRNIFRTERRTNLKLGTLKKYEDPYQRQSQCCKVVWCVWQVLTDKSRTKRLQTLQEEWLSPTERASVSAISLRHILVSPGYAPGTIAVNVTWMKTGFNACQTHRNIYPYIFNRFPVIQPASSKVRHFSTFFAHFGLPGYAPGTIAVNVTWMERGFNAGQQHSSIYPFIFNRLRAILVGNCNFYPSCI